MKWGVCVGQGSGDEQLAGHNGRAQNKNAILTGALVSGYPPYRHARQLKTEFDNLFFYVWNLSLYICSMTCLLSNLF